MTDPTRVTDWSAERLDTLPGGTVVAWEGAYYSWALHDTPGSLYGWLSGERWSSAEGAHPALGARVRHRFGH